MGKDVPDVAGGFALSAIAASVLGIVTAPIITVAYGLTDEGVSPAWGEAAADVLGPTVTFAAPDTVYATYGKIYLFVFLGILVGLIGLRRGRSRRMQGLERWGFRLSYVGLVLAALGNIPDYWVLEDTVIETILFVAGTLLGLLCMVVGGVLLGIGWLRSPEAPRLGAWLLLLAVPGMVLLGAVGFGNLPSMPAMWFCFAWLALGIFMLRSPAAGWRPRQDSNLRPTD